MSANNRKRRETAIHNGKMTYGKEVTSVIPACVECDTILYGRVHMASVGLYRRCKCPGRVWANKASGWEIYRD